MLSEQESKTCPRIHHQTLRMANNPKPSGFSNTLGGKIAILERTKALVEKSAIIITIPVSGVTKENTDILRKALPKSVKASVVKNSLMKKVQLFLYLPFLTENCSDLFVLPLNERLWKDHSSSP